LTTAVPSSLKATSLLHARVLAAVRKIGRVAQFVDGFELSRELAALIPGDYIGLLLSCCDAWHLYHQLVERAASMPAWLVGAMSAHSGLIKP